MRNIPATFPGWDEMDKDQLNGTESYGDQKDHLESWAIKFDSDNITHYKVESKDKSYSKEYTKEELIGKLC